MRISSIMIGIGAVALGACGGTDSGKSEANATGNAEAAKPKKRAYCFFPDEKSTTGWALSVAANGDLIVKGRGNLEDPRYMAKLGEPEIEGTTADVPLKMAPNDTGYQSADNGWWDVTATIPAASNVQTVHVTCGAKTLATLPVPATKKAG
jgi:hypothetical protein